MADQQKTDGLFSSVPARVVASLITTGILAVLGAVWATSQPQRDTLFSVFFLTLAILWCLFAAGSSLVTAYSGRKRARAGSRLYMAMNAVCSLGACILWLHLMSNVRDAITSVFWFMAFGLWTLGLVHSISMTHWHLMVEFTMLLHQFKDKLSKDEYDRWQHRLEDLGGFRVEPKPTQENAAEKVET